MSEPENKAPQKEDEHPEGIATALLPSAPAMPANVKAEDKRISKKKAAKKREEEEEEEEEDEDEDDEDDEDDDDDEDDELETEREIPVTYTATEVKSAFGSIYRFTQPYLAAHRKGITLVLIGLLIETAFNVLMPLALKYLIDVVFDEQGERSELVTILVVLGIGGLITSIVAIWYEWHDSKVSSAICSDVRKNLFDHIQKLPVSFYSRSKRGEILSRFSNDMLTYEEAVINFANWGLLPLLELVAGIILLLVLNWQLGLVALLIFPLVLIGPRLITPRAVQASYDVKNAEASELGVVQENVSAQTVVKAFGLQLQSRRWFGLRNEVLRKAQQRSTFLNTMVERSITIAVLWLHLLVLAVGAYLTFNDVITVGTFIAFESVFWEISYNINHLTQYIPVSIDASGAVRHMNEILDEPVRVGDKPDAQELPRIGREIAFKNVTFGYAEGEKQIERLSLTIPAGHRVAIVGSSGAGKSTILNLILRFYDPHSGAVEIDGVSIADVTRDSLRSQIAIVFQENVLFNTSFRENIRLGNLGATDEEVIAAAKQAEIHKFIMSQPAGYDTMVGERGDTLSGGQRQRIAIARALVRNPAILLLDEATSALDQTTEAAINKTINKVAQGRTTIFVTHRLTSVTQMDEIIVMDHGRVAQRGTHAELTKQKGIYRSLWQDQKRGS